MPEFYDAFISYGRADSKAFATKLYERLTAQGYEVWFDQNDIPLGVDYQQEIDEGLERSHNFIFIMSPHSVNSPYCGLEVERAVARNKRIIPLLHVDELPRETWQQRNPDGTDERWAEYQEQKLHFGDVRNHRIHPLLGKINWIYGREGIDDFEAAFIGLVSIFERHRDYVQQHTELLSRALVWEANQRRSQFLLVGQDRQQAEKWLKVRFQNEQLPCTPTALHAEYITESLKNANNMMTQVFLSYSTEDIAVMEQVRRSLWMQSITVWTNKTDIQTGEAFQAAIDRGIEQADNLVYLLSPNSLKSAYCQYELRQAIAFNKRVIPLLIDPTPIKDQPVELRGLQYIDLTDNEREEDYVSDESQLLKILRTDELYFQTHKILLAKAIKWDEQHKNPSMLLRGYNLQQAKSWLKVAQTRTNQKPTMLQSAFIEESLQQPPATSLDVFVSYSRVDSDFARKLNDNLQICGKLTWFDQESIATSSANFEQEIYQGIEVSDNFLFILSPEAVNSVYCADEVEYAAKRNKRIITVLHRAVDLGSLHPELAKVQWIDFNQNEGDFGQNFNQLVRAIDTDREHVHNHTKWSQRAIEWEQKEQTNDLLLRGNEFAIAQEWLKTAHEEKKKPVPTALQELFLKQSEAAIEAEVRKEKRQKVILKGLLGIMTGLAIAAGMAWNVADKQRWRAEQQQLMAEGKSSLLLSSSGQGFDALLASLRAATKLQQTKKLQANDQSVAIVLRSLRDSIYSVHEQNRIQAHNEAVYGISFSPNGQTLASASGDRTIKLWNLDGSNQAILEGHEDIVYQVKFSSDGQTLASVSGDRTVKLWNPDGSLRQTLTGHTDAVYGVAFSPDNQLIASGSADGTVKLWDNGGTLLQTLAGEDSNAIRYVSFSPDGQTIAAAKGNTIQIWNQTGSLEKTITGHNRSVLSVNFSPDGQQLIATSEDGTIKFFDLEGEPLANRFQGNIVYNAKFSRDGKIIVSAGGDTLVKVWHPDGTVLQTFKGHQDGIYDISISPDGQAIASASGDGEIRIWRNGGLSARKFYDHQGEVFDAVFSPDGEMIASVGADQVIRLWQQDGTALKTLTGHTDLIHNVTFSPDSEMLVSGSWDGTAKLWTRGGQLIKTLTGHTGQVYGVLFSPDGSLLATTSGDGTIKLWDKTGNLLHTLQGHTDVVHNVSFSPDSQFLISASHDKTLRLWSRDGQLIEVFTGHTNWVHAVAFSPDGQMIASASHDRTVKLWDLDGNLLTTLLGHTGKVKGITFSPDSQMVASSSEDQTIRFWQKDGTLITILRGHSDAIHGIHFSPDGNLFTSSSVDNTVALWQVENVNSLDGLIEQSCDWLRGYLQHNPAVSEADRSLCPQKEEV